LRPLTLFMAAPLDFFPTRGRESSPCSVQPDRRGILRATQYGRDLGGGEVLPGREQQDLAILLLECLERSKHCTCVKTRGGDFVQLGPPVSQFRQARGEPLAARTRSATIREDTTGDPIEPERDLLVARGIVKASPEDQEGFRDHVVGLAAIRHAPSCVRKQRFVLLFVEATEARLRGTLLGRRAHRLVLGGQVSDGRKRPPNAPP